MVCSLFEYPGTQELLEEVTEVVIPHPSAHPFHEWATRNRVIIGRDIPFDHPLVGLPGWPGEAHTQVGEGILGTAVRSKAVGVPAKVSFPYRFKDHAEGFLDDAVGDGRDPEGAPLPVGFGDVHPAYRCWDKLFGTEDVAESGEILLSMRLEGPHRLAINAGRRRCCGFFCRRRTSALPEAGHRVALEMLAEGKLREENLHGTINCDGINSRGEICGVTTTSGLAWKIPGRLGDSPILGAGLYVDGAIGAAGSTGRGEANLFNLCSFVIIEEMRRGANPKDAGMEVLNRIKSNTIEKRLLNSKGLPNFGINFYILNAKGEYAGVTMYEGSSFALCTENGPQTLKAEPLLQGKPSD